MHRLFCGQQVAAPARSRVERASLNGQLAAPKIALLGPIDKLQEKDFSASRLPATLSLHVERSPQQVIDFPCFAAFRLSAICGFRSMKNHGAFFARRGIGFAGAPHHTALILYEMEKGKRVRR